jgi:diguanylate cyclase (GGDEF)-like protein/putative nucleotidyltransferase with HDIG domain
MRTFSDLRPLARLYVTSVVLVGLTTVLHSVYKLFVNPIGPEWLVLAGLTLLTGSFTIKVPSITARLTVSETFVFASVLLFGIAAGTLTVVLETLVIALWVKREARSAYRALFNVAASALSIWMAATIFYALSGIEPLSNRETPLSQLFGPLAILTAVFFLSNSWLVALAVGFEKNQSPLSIWWRLFPWLSVNYFSGASVAAVIVTYTNKLNPTALFGTIVIIVPLLLVSYLTFRTAMGRVEDSNRHLSELNKLYLSTIETLAMAIDAKDQITHGHIRRVQTYAVGLARRVGISDERLIKAIEAAALLHDMGKLAVPEYILNKPGKLTPAEFEKMKLHASVGADILSAINFPYPVVPIVRHHHENWNGTGYPAGLAATDIPIGARILSVVDCFDALTSDRPYRPKLSDEDAITILLERRGSMYDPLIVDTFVGVHQEIAPAPSPETDTPAAALQEITGSAYVAQSPNVAAPLKDIAASGEEMLTLYELARALAGEMTLAEAGDIVAHHIRRLIPSAVQVLYVYDSKSDDLIATHCVGDGCSNIRGLRISLGQRVSGWVAANRQTVVNSDAQLDLGDAVRSHSPKLKSCISTPLVSEDRLAGVLSLYSIDTNGFTDDDRRIIDAVGHQVAHLMQRGSKAAGDTAGSDMLNSLPHFDELEEFARVARTDELNPQTLSLVFIDIARFREISDSHGKGTEDHVRRHVADQTGGTLRQGDILFRRGSSGFVALLNDVTDTLAEQVGQRIYDGVKARPLVLPDGRGIDLDIEVTIVSTPRDGQSLASLVSAARVRAAASTNDTRGSRVH